MDNPAYPIAAAFLFAATCFAVVVAYWRRDFW